MPEIYDSHYDKLHAANLLPQDGTVVVEVGINDGRGLKRLKEYFPKAHIFGIERHVRHEDFKTSFDSLVHQSKGIATLIIQESPMPFDWPIPYDFCSIDLGPDPNVNFENLVYWLKAKKENGVLALGVPRSTPEKLAKKEILKQMLQKAGLKYQEVYYWFVFQ